MHIFLTGDIQSGKSTIISKVYKHFQGVIGGFSTYFVGERTSAEKKLYMSDMMNISDISERNTQVVTFFTRGIAQPVPEAFDRFGGEILRKARISAGLIIMDECGRLEKDAHVFQQEVLQTLDGNIPVIGVVRKSETGWLDQIRNHPKVEMITVTEKNRDELPTMLIQGERLWKK